jgi:alpha-D-ribose 1-methylphosphonate 5-triphosphate synthase subunit PhnL
MSRQNLPFAYGTADAGGEIAQLRRVLALVEELAGVSAAPDSDSLDEAARVSAAYVSAQPIVQRQFDIEAARTARWAAAGLEALVTLEERGWPVKPAAGKLAEELRKALGQLRETVSP